MYIYIYIHYAHLLCMEEVQLTQDKTPVPENRLPTVVVAVVSNSSNSIVFFITIIF